MTELQCERVGLIGVGNMGERIGRRILDNGVSLIGYDTDASKLKSAGVPAADSIGELAMNTDIILLSLPNSQIVESVVRGEWGFLAHAREGQAIIDQSVV